MAAKSSSLDQTLLNWLLSFETQVAGPVVVSLLIEGGKLHFLSSINKTVYLESKDSDDDAEGPAEVDLEALRKEWDRRLLNSVPRYIQ